MQMLFDQNSESEEENEEEPRSKRSRTEKQSELIDLTDEVPLALKDLRVAQKDIEVLKTERQLFQNHFRQAFQDAVGAMKNQVMEQSQQFEKERAHFIEIINGYKKEIAELKLSSKDNSSNSEDGSSSSGREQPVSGVSKKQLSLINTLDSESRRMRDEIKVSNDNQDKIRNQLVMIKRDIIELQKTSQQQDTSLNPKTQITLVSLHEELADVKNDIQNHKEQYRFDLGRLTQRTSVLEQVSDANLFLNCVHSAADLDIDIDDAAAQPTTTVAIEATDCSELIVADDVEPEIPINAL